MPSIINIFRIRKAILAAIAVGMLTACSDDALKGTLVPDGNEAGYITLNLSCSKATRADTEALNDTLNEYKINTALVCMYPSNNPSDTAMVTTFISNLDITDTGTAKILLDNETRLQLFPSDAITCGAYVVANISQAKADSVINGFTTVSAVKNMVVYNEFANKQSRSGFAMDGTTSDITLSRNANNYSAAGSIDLKRVASKITIAVSIASTVEGDGNTSGVWRPNTDYIVALLNNGVCRSSFITMGDDAYVPQDVDYFSTQNVGYSSQNNYGPRRLYYTETSGETESTEETETTTGRGYPYVLTRPFYTMPNSWEDGDNRMTYLTLRVPWTNDNGASYKYCYYSVPITKENSIGRNISYRVNVYIDMLGSFEIDEPIVPDLENLSYYAVEWGTVTTEVEISSNRYLVVDQNEFTLNNDPDIDIPVYTSHETIVKSATLTYYRYNYNENGTEQEVEISNDVWERSKTTTATTGYTAGEIFSREIVTNENDTYLRFEHELVEWQAFNSSGTKISLKYDELTNNRTISDISYYLRPNEPESSYTRYVAKITIVHKDKLNEPDEKFYTEEITITQYPQMYIETKQNYYTTDGSKATAAEGRMFVNGWQTSTHSRDWYRASGLSGNNTNPNQYVITITQLNEGEGDYFYIGDPRTSEVDLLYGSEVCITTAENDKGEMTGYGDYVMKDGASNELSNAEGTQLDWAKDAYGNKLTYYYPTDSDKSKARIIAPKFRVASSYGTHARTSSYDTDRARCAGYQELGYPAGRWRMPTVAEMEFIIKLSQQGKIPVLFNETDTTTSGSGDNQTTTTTDTYYMSAQGPVRVKDVSDSNIGYLRTPESTTTDYNGDPKDGSVRCVYDDWYWGSDPIDDPTTFTWGDQKR